MDTSVTLIVSAGIQGIVGFLVWVAVRRPIDNLSRENVEMKRDLRELANQRVAAIEETQKQHSHAINDAARVNMTIPECQEKHRELARAQRDFGMAVTDLARVQEAMKNTASFVKEVNQRMIGVIADIASIKSLEGRVERLEDRQ
jgi:FtsZ-binding cell division protein ZapB